MVNCVFCETLGSQGYATLGSQVKPVVKIMWFCITSARWGFIKFIQLLTPLHQKILAKYLETPIFHDLD